MEEHLERVFANVNTWLRFAEAKNAILVGLAGSAALGALGLLKDQTVFPVWFLWYLYEFAALELTALIFSLVSFLPQTRMGTECGSSVAEFNGNLLFYGDIAKYGPADYMAAIRRAYGVPSSAPTKIEEDYCAQIVVNSGIALRKYGLFRTALWFALAGIITPLFALVFYLVPWGKARK